MKKIFNILLIAGLFVLTFTGCGKTYDGFKQDASKNWESTKEGSKRAWESTKEAIHDATE